MIKSINYICLVFAFIAIHQACQLPDVFNCSQNYCTGEDYINSSSFIIYNCSQPLNLVANTLDIKGSYTGLNLTGANIQISDISVQSILNINVSGTLSISANINIGQQLLIFSPNNNTFSTITFSTATIVANKIVVIGAEVIQIISSKIVTKWNLCFYASIDINNISNQLNTLIQSQNAFQISLLQLSILLTAQSNITILQSTIISLSLNIATYNISIVQSVLNTTGQACRTNSGRGRGAIIQFQNTHCTSGSSSSGFGLISNTDLCYDIVQYFLFLSHSFPYMSKGPKLSTGSGGYGYNLLSNEKGSGGGIIFILCNIIQMQNSKLEASGGDVDIGDDLSAGSAGTIFISSKNIVGIGNNNVSAMGGNSFNNNGAGGGGIVKISYTNYTYNSIGSIWVNINQGYQPNYQNFSTSSNGLFYGTLCTSGQQANYLGCQSCGNNTYSTLGDPICRLCPYSQQFQINQSPGKSLISQCYLVNKNVKLLFWFTPGNIDIISISLYIILMCIFIIIGAFLKRKIKKQKLGEQFKFEDVQKDIEEKKMLAVKLRNQKIIKPEELMYHVHRISCFGSNTQQSPWVLPQTIPPDVTKYVLPQVFLDFAERFNITAQWTHLEYWLSKILLIIYPLYWIYLDKIKKQKYTKLSTLLQHAIDYNLINNYDYQDKSLVTIKFSKNKDYTNCYLDFFVYQRADMKYFTLNSPFILYLSGEGNFLRPFYLQQQDIFFRMIFFVINRHLMRSEDASDGKKQLFDCMKNQKRRQINCTQLNRFLRKLNTQSCTLDLSSPNSNIIEVIWKMIELMQTWNRQFFNKLAVQLDLLMFVLKSNGEEVQNQIKILTKKDKQQFVNSMTQKLISIESWQKSSLKIGIFIYNPDQQILKQDNIINTKNTKDVEKKGRVSQGLFQDNRQSLLTIQQPSMNVVHKKSYKKIFISFLNLIRYLVLSHRTSSYDQYTIKFLQSFFILLQTMLFFIWSIKIQIPYVSVNLFCPLVGIIWFISDSYGFGKLYMILNVMCLVNEIATLITYTIVDYYILGNDKYEFIIKNIVSSLINMIIICLMMFIGNKAITLSKKLSFKKQEEKRQLKI